MRFVGALSGERDALVGEPANMGVEHTDVDELTFAGLGLVANGGENTDGRVHAGHEIADRHSDFHWLTVRHAGQAHHAAHGLNQAIISRARRIRAGLAETSDRAIDQARELGFQLLVAKVVALQGAGFEVLDEDIAIGHQLPGKRLAFRRAEVDGDRPFIAVGAGVIGALACLFTLIVALIRRRKTAGVVAGSRALHLDDFSAEIAQQLCAVRSREDAREIEYPISVERTFHLRSPLLIVVVLPYDVRSNEANGNLG